MAAPGRPKRDDVDFVNAAAQLAEDHAHELGFMPRLFAQTSLPYRDPGDVREWQRRNGNLTLTVQPGPSIRKKDGATEALGLPFGSVPRLILAWLGTEVVRTQQRQIVLGESIADFMRNIDMGASTGGRNGSLTRFRTQINRLFKATITVSIDDQPDQDWFESARIADGANLWWSPAKTSNPEQQDLLRSTVTLSERFYEEALTHPVPISVEALALLGGSARRIDIYTWLTYRMSYLSQATTIPWEALRWQFGSDVGTTPAHMRSFRQKFERALSEVLIIYRDAAPNVEATSAGLSIRPSRPHIEPKAARAALGRVTRSSS